MTHSVILEGVTKKYKMFHKQSEKLMDLLSSKGRGEDFYALQDISFTADKGDVIGVVGVNGSGKSVLSNIIAGVTPPSSGKFEVNGKTAIIAINAGLNNQLTGRENIELKLLMLGFSRREIRRIEPEIIEFAEIGQFIDQPVKTYSSGMKSRLGFGISVNVDPDILVIDEALSVGDKTFTDKCMEKMNGFKERGKTIFFISHALGQVKSFCDKVLWLEFGEVRKFGPVEEVLPEYKAFVKEFRSLTKEEKEAYRENVRRKQSGEILLAK